MFVFGFDGGGVAEINLYPLPHYCFAIKDVSDSNCCLFVEEGYDYATEALEWGP